MTRAPSPSRAGAKRDDSDWSWGDEELSGGASDQAGTTEDWKPEDDAELSDEDALEEESAGEDDFEHDFEDDEESADEEALADEEESFASEAPGDIEESSDEEEEEESSDEEELAEEEFADEAEEPGKQRESGHERKRTRSPDRAATAGGAARAPRSGPCGVPHRVKAPPLPSRVQAPSAGRQLWTCREGFEAHLFEELAWAGLHPRLLGAALLESDPSASVTPAFARMGFKMDSVFEGNLGGNVTAIVRVLRQRVRTDPVLVQAWTADTLAGNALSAQAEALERAVEAELAQSPEHGTPAAAADSAREAPTLFASDRAKSSVRDAGTLATSERGNTSAREASGTVADTSPRQEGNAQLWPARLRELNGWLGQVCVVTGDVVAVGVVRAREAISLAPGGRRRMKRTADAPSRAALKLEEALDGLSIEPGRGELCVDLGAAPGGWTQRLVARGARVIAVDPAKLMPELTGNKRVRHVRESAFDYEPEEPADWLFCDMAWRPLEVAQLLAKWGRKGWATALVANIKLPMKDKNPILLRVRSVLEQDGGWKDLAIRQLYHDRDEVTVTARMK